MKMIFSKVLPVSALVLLLTFSVNAFGQADNAMVTDVTVNMLTWVKHLNNDVDKYFNREKADDLKQQLEFFKQDLKNYMKTRKALSDSLFRNNIAPGKKDETNLEILKIKMSAVMERARGVSDLVGEELQKEGDNLNNQLYKVLYEDQGRYLSYLEAFLAGIDVTKKELAVDGSVCYTRLEECTTLITTLEGKIDRKMKK
ncbi:hypothetical protein ACTJJ0_25650 [Chitinophaga sp. 22321]|uniref:Uncharacterized protein n=1 Tax=Chitinophaga hostae TaxID=2831022 RepID=A0ABS5J5D3_9BACT|nr:hypothetical protein [Chitinophaga hostae]MBS0030427.1 hypothetical protein [Chitinophaga hostae]